MTNEEISTKLKGTPVQGLYGATLGFFTGFAAVALFGPTANAFKGAMGLSPLLVGLLVAVPALSGSLLRIPFSAWADTVGGRKPFLILLSLSIIGMLGLSLVVYLLYPNNMSPDLYPFLLILGALSGCGIATFSVGVSQVSYWYPQKRQGSALGIYAGVANLAPGIFSIILPFALSSIGLVGSYIAWLFFLVIGTVFYYLLGRNSWYFQLRKQGLSPDDARIDAKKQGQELFPAKKLSESLKISAKIWKTWSLVIIYFTSFGGFIALTAWFPTYWTSFFAVAPVTAGLLTALYSILTSLTRMGGGVVSDKLGGENTLLLALITALAGGSLMTVSSSFYLSISAVILMALGMGMSNAAVFKIVPQEIPQAVGGASGWVGGLGAFGGFAIPPIMSAFVNGPGDIGYARGFLVFIILSGVSLTMAYILKRTARNRIKNNL